MSALQFIDQPRLFHPVQQLCQVLGVVPSHYYGWQHKQAAQALGTVEPAWETEMLAVFDRHQRRHGTRWRRVELQEPGHRVGRQALRTGLRRHGREALQPKSFVPRTTDSTHGQRCAPNLLRDQPRPTRVTQANRVWVSDITYLPLIGGTWAYLCAFQDVCTRHVVGRQVRGQLFKLLRQGDGCVEFAPTLVTFGGDAHPRAELPRRACKIGRQPAATPTGEAQGGHR